MFKDLIKNKSDSIFNICIIGNSTLDIVHIDNSIKKTFGGSISFIIPWINIILKGSVIDIYCSGPENCLSHIYVDESINIHIQEDKIHTTFELIYTNQKRIVKIIKAPEKIKYDYFLLNKPKKDPDVIICCPVYNEISEDFVRNIQKLYPNAIIGLDAQGFVRTKDKNCYIIQNNWIPSESMLKSLIIISISKDELSKKMFKTISEFKKNYQIITLGVKGSILLSNHEFNNESFLIPAFSIKNRLDINPTGAGDIFFAGTLIFYLLSKNIKKSMILGSLLAKIHLEEKPDYQKLADDDYKVNKMNQTFSKIPKEYYKIIKVINNRQTSNLLWKNR
ncbi:MAG: hypothetical protein HeimC3_03050 [Candidatus Heimdallarchaeota archaeon LC_3]|nr:MAG: hypothetical protein HeimC3_03050 [Candidatus Heimdallarchaeota archaeon LC_3]